MHVVFILSSQKLPFVKVIFFNYETLGKYQQTFTAE